MSVRTIVIGSLNTDLVATGLLHIPKPGEHVYGEELHIGPGGKSRNIADMLAHLAPKDSVAMIGRTVEDSYGLWRQPLEALEKAGVNTEYVQVEPSDGSNLPAIALIAVDERGNNQIIVLPGASERFRKEDIAAATELFESVGNNEGALVLTLECPLDTAIYAVKLANQYGLKVLFDPGGLQANMDVQKLTSAGIYLIKPNEHEENPLFAQLLAELIAASDLPEGVFNVLYGDGSIGEKLARADIDLLSFTGSSVTGRKLATIAGKKFIPFVAELGGSNPLVVCEDVAVDEQLAQYIADRRFKNAGQACDAVKRLIVHESNLGALLPLLQQAVEKLKVGDPLDEKTDIGPLVAERQVKTIESQVANAVKYGATVLCGGTRVENMPGSYYAPTLLTNVTRNMRVWREETFGPVLPIVTFKTLEQAAELANDTPYGLGAHIFTNDAHTFEYFVETIEAASIAQNYVGYWDPRNPFGGYKQSGRGRTHGEFGFSEVTQLKLVSKENV